MLSVALRAAFVALLLAVIVRSDEAVYVDDALNSGWQNWGWNTTVNWAATDLKVGKSSISAVSGAWAGLSLKSPNVISTYSALKFDIAADPNALRLYFEGSGDGAQSSNILFSSISTSIHPTSFTTVIIDFRALPPNGSPLGPGAWDRINFQATGNGASYHLDNIQLLTSLIIPEFFSAEPLSNNIIAVTTNGTFGLNNVAVTLNNSTVPVTSMTTYVPPDTPERTISYLQLASPLVPGSLSIVAGSLSVSYTLPPAQSGSIVLSVKTPISPLIYGVNWPSSASYIQQLGVTISRWGGNTATPYNPFGDFTNAGNDWYFENRASENGGANDWIKWIKAAGSQAMMTIPALDWVAKDATSYSYPKTRHPGQQKFDPYNSDAGNGFIPSTNTWAQPPPDPAGVYAPWNATAAHTWLSGLTNKPDYVFIDNEMEIASSTHQDMHPSAMSYDEELTRVVTYAKVTKDALPNVKVAAPSTCSWWFYWTSGIGYSDNAAHGNVDFLPWFLGQMSRASATAGKRLLDYLDIHYYFQPDLSANDAAAKALRLRMTRSLWDPEYVDESWVGTNPQNHQPNGAAVWLIPRMKKLIADNYPGTKFSISEWASTADDDISGGLVTTDVLGIFGRYGVDTATYWSNPDAKGPVGLGFWLYRGSGTYFGSTSVQVNLANPNAANTYGVYAATENGKLSVVIVNKDTKPLSLNLPDLPHGSYFLRHFGGASGIAKWQTTITISAGDYILVPSYTAVFLKQS